MTEARSLMNRSWIALVTLSALAAGCSASKEEAPAPAATAPKPAAAASAPEAMPAGMAHGDHSAKHGGVFFMASNGFHHLEGTYPEAGLFRLYLYDDHTRPIDAQGVTGSVHVDGRPEEESVPLAYDAASKALEARLDPPPPLPLSLAVLVNLTHPSTGATAESLFNFDFAAVGDVPVSAPAGGGHGEGGHSHLAPHGGQVVTVGDYHFELVDSGSMLTLWLLDAQEKTLPVDGMTATLLLQPKSGPPRTITLDPMGSVHFMANNPLRPGEAAAAVASVNMNGITYTARFTVGSGS